MDTLNFYDTVSLVRINLQMRYLSLN